MRSTIYILSILLIPFAGTTLHAQTQSITVIQDSRLPILSKKTIEANEFNTRNARRFTQGYRLMVLNTNDRNQLNETKLKLMKLFPELKTYTEYQSPRFKLKAGNFKDNTEAATYQKKLKDFFSQEIYIIRDVIEVNPDKSASLEKQ